MATHDLARERAPLPVPGVLSRVVPKHEPSGPALTCSGTLGTNGHGRSSFDGGAHIGGQLLGGELCSSISVERDPAGEAATGGSHVDGGDDLVRVLVLTHGVSQDWARVHATHGAQVDPVVRTAQVGNVRYLHAVKGTLVPQAGAVVHIGHWRPTAGPGAASVFRSVRPWRRINWATARTPASASPRVRAWWRRGAP